MNAAGRRLIGCLCTLLREDWRKGATLLLLLCAVSLRAQINTDRIMEVGRNALYYDDYALSIQYFNRVIEAKPHLYEPYFFRGLAKFYLEDYSGAETDCSRTLERNPFYPNAYELRGLARINLKKFGLASDDYARATEYEPESKPLWHNWLLCTIETDSLDRADSIAAVVTKKWPHYADGYVMRAQIEFERQDTATAEQWVDTALVADRFNLTALGMKSALLLSREQWALADTVLTEALRLEPRNARHLVNRALCRYHAKDLRGAMSDYDQAIDIDPSNFAAHYNRGLLRANVGDDNHALEDFDFILRQDPSDVMATYNRAELRMNTGDYAGAAADYTTLIETYPKFVAGYARRAEARRHLGDKRGADRDEEHVLKEQIAHRFGYSTATSRGKDTTRKKSEVNLDDYQQLVTDDDTDDKQYESQWRGKIQNHTTDLTPQPPLAPKPYRRAVLGTTPDFDLALEQLFTQETDAAIASLTRAIEANGDFAEAYYNRAYAHQLQGNYALALQDLDRAIKLNPQFAQAHYNRGILHILMGNNAEAIPDLSLAGEQGIYAAYSIIKHHAASSSAKRTK